MKLNSSTSLILCTMACFLMAFSWFSSGCSFAQEAADQPQPWPGTPESRKHRLEATLSGIQIVPGAWRPHFPWEQIAWIKLPWNSHDYVWLDFPEALFVDGGLLFLSHISVSLAQLSPDMPPVAWTKVPGGLTFERTLPNRVVFGGSLVKASESTVALTLYIRNETDKPLSGIRFQTCAFLRQAKEFSAFTAGNKFIHVPDSGWITYEAAREKAEGHGRYRLRWNGGNVADRPVIVTVNDRTGEGDSRQMIALTWDGDTHMLFANPRHPCMHADPSVPDIEPGQTATAHGRLIFFEGTLEELWDEFFELKD